MIDKNIIVILINEAIDFLSQPLCPEDISCGWTENVRQNWRRGLTVLKADIESGKQSLPGRVNLARDLGMDGIIYGELGERIARIGNLIMGLNSGE